MASVSKDGKIIFNDVKGINEDLRSNVISKIEFIKSLDKSLIIPERNFHIQSIQELIFQ